MQHPLKFSSGYTESIALDVWQAHAVDVGVVDIGPIFVVAETTTQDGPTQLKDLITQRRCATATVWSLEELKNPLSVCLGDSQVTEDRNHGEVRRMSPSIRTTCFRHSVPELCTVLQAAVVGRHPNTIMLPLLRLIIR